MARKWTMYKASGRVSYFVTDIMAPSQERALEIANSNFGDDVSFAADKGNAELLEVNVEPFRPATKEEVIDGYGEEAWEEKAPNAEPSHKDSAGAERKA
jgi:hypothetical protein